MTQGISFIGLFSRQQTSALSGLTRTQKTALDSCALAAAPNHQSAKLSDMAKAIKSGQNKNLINFKGTRKELAKYLSYQVSSGDLDIKSKPYQKTIRTADGKVYKVSIDTDKNYESFSKKFSGNTSARITFTNISGNTKKKTTSNSNTVYNFSYNVNTFKNNPIATKEYAAMKKRFGAI